MRFYNIFAAGIFCGALTITGCGRGTQAVNAASDAAAIAAKEATSGTCIGGQPQGLQASAGQPSAPGQPNTPGQPYAPGQQPYVQDTYYSILHRPVLIVDQPTAAVYTPEPEPLYETPPPAIRPAASRPATRATVRSDRSRHHGRSKGKSAAIVGGSAAAGAGIGAIAGGGKGAAIGAISGGGAGFIYDRLTHNHR